MFNQILAFSVWYPLPSLVVGIVLYFYFIKFKKTAIAGFDAVFLILIPAYGLGNFMYKEDLKHSKPNQLPKKWYINHYMSIIHIVIVPVSVYYYFYLVSVFINGIDIRGENYGDYLFSFIEILGVFIFQSYIFLGILVVGVMMIFIPHYNAKIIEMDILKQNQKIPLQNIVKHSFAKRTDKETNTTILYQFTNLYIRRQIIIRNNDIYFLSTENPQINGEKLSATLLNEFNFDSNEYIEFEEFKSYWNLKK